MVRCALPAVVKGRSNSTEGVGSGLPKSARPVCPGQLRLMNGRVSATGPSPTGLERSLGTRSRRGSSFCPMVTREGAFPPGGVGALGAPWD